MAKVKVFVTDRQTNGQRDGRMRLLPRFRESQEKLNMMTFLRNKIITLVTTTFDIIFILGSKNA